MLNLSAWEGRTPDFGARMVDIVDFISAFVSVEGVNFEASFGIESETK